MVTLSHAFAQQHYLNEVNYVYRAIEVGLKPWRPGRITAYQEEDFSFVRYSPIKFIFETELLPDLRCVLYPQVLLDPRDMFFRMADEAFRYFRYRPALPVDDHIILGED